MKDESESISDDEFVYRLVHEMRFRDNKNPMISPSAFEPRVKGNAPDYDGISLFRASCLESVDQVLEVIPQEKRSSIGVVKIPIVELKRMGLSVVSNPMKDDKVLGNGLKSVLPCRFDILEFFFELTHTS